MIVAVNAIYLICVKKPEKIQDFNGVWTRDLAITSAMLYQLSYEATDVSGIIAQLVEHRTCNREVKGLNPVEVLNFFRLLYAIA